MKKINFLWLVGIFMLLPICLVSCSDDDENDPDSVGFYEKNLVGEWDANETTGDRIYTLNSDGTCKMYYSSYTYDHSSTIEGTWNVAKVNDEILFSAKSKGSGFNFTYIITSLKNGVLNAVNSKDLRPIVWNKNK